MIYKQPLSNQFIMKQKQEQDKNVGGSFPNPENPYGGELEPNQIKVVQKITKKTGVPFNIVRLVMYEQYAANLEEILEVPF